MFVISPSYVLMAEPTDDTNLTFTTIIFFRCILDNDESHSVEIVRF